MTDKSAAAIDGDYSNFQLVQSRKVCRIVIEFPIERADEVVRLLGWPKPHSTTRCAVALLTDTVPREGKAAGDGALLREECPSPEGITPADSGAPVVQYKSPAAPSPRRWQDMSMPEQVGVRCQDANFWRYLGVTDHNDATTAVRAKCLVISRVSILPGTVAGQTWLAIERDFQAWRKAPTMGADQ